MLCNMFFSVCSAIFLEHFDETRSSTCQVIKTSVLVRKLLQTEKFLRETVRETFVVCLFSCAAQTGTVVTKLKSSSNTRQVFEQFLFNGTPRASCFLGLGYVSHCYTVGKQFTVRLCSVQFRRVLARYLTCSRSACLKSVEMRILI